ncbi:MULTISPECIES: aminoglycoside phosphotransferase family protein [unclassified Ruegeria]|uniref:aminoglycoside phosphotransferase family protein n=1 Tax=unclassified Ruegeria TaxID=2625375 RepID=UPI001488D545|nr:MULTISPECIES: aminoglycoside phosphotransferase family protein [unclassified Ruegeria]
MQGTAQEFMTEWHLTEICHIADTGHAQVWKVRTQRGQEAALKVYRRADMGNEGPGLHLLERWQDRGAVEILARAESAVLMEWLEGPSLGDIARDGAPDRAAEMLAETARRLHQGPPPSQAGLEPLEKTFAAMFDCQFASDCPAGLKQDMSRGMAFARALLNGTEFKHPLHGDLHHDNVIVTDAGLRVIDAKGYVGDPAFELANALRNPKGLEDLMRQPAHIECCLTLYADAMNAPRGRVAKWAAAKCTLSIFWRSGGTLSGDREADLLNLLLAVADQ